VRGRHLPRLADWNNLQQLLAVVEDARADLRETLAGAIAIPAA
jgi:hypothetical protein